MSSSTFIFETRLLKSFKKRADRKRQIYDFLLTSSHKDAAQAIEKVKKEIVETEKVIEQLEEKLQIEEPKIIQSFYEAFIVSENTDKKIKVGMYSTEEKARKAIELALLYYQRTRCKTDEEMESMGSSIKEYAVE